MNNFASSSPAPRPASIDSPQPSLAMLLHLIDAREDGRIGGPTVDAKIAQLTARLTVPMTNL